MLLILASDPVHLIAQDNFAPLISKDLDQLNTDSVYPVDKFKSNLVTVQQGSSKPPKLAATLTTTTGRVQHAFVEDFYNRIYIDPATINLGNVATDVRTDIEVWNAFLEPQLLESIDGTNTDGIVLEGPINPPTYFNALESRIYELVASVEGPPTIDSIFEFSFRDVKLQVLVRGSRVRVWAYIPNREYKEELEWLTDIVPSYITEQRFQMRSSPRQKLYFTHDLTIDDYRRVVEEARFWNDKLYSVPVWQDCTPVYEDLLIGVTSININTENAHYYDGCICVVWNNREHKALEVEKVLPNSLVLKQPIEAKVEAPYYVAPSFLCKAENGFTIQRSHNNRVEVSVNFVAYDTPDIPSTDYPQYKGFVVITDRTAVVGSITETISKSLEVFDNNLSTPKFIVENLRENNRFTLGWAKNTRKEAWKLRQFLHYLKGRLVPFWIMDWGKSIELTQDIQSGNSMQITPIYTSTFYKNGLYVCIVTKGGQQVYRKILTGTLLSNNEELVIVDEDFTDVILKKDVRAIYVMYLCRSDTDKIEIQHSGVGQIKVSMVVKELLNAV